MEVKAGYRQTEVGVIPEDWEVVSFLELSQKILDYRGRTPRKLGMEWGGGDIPALSAGNVKMGSIDFDEECYFGSDVLYKHWMINGDVEKDDIIVTLEAPLGNVALIPDSRKYILSQRTILLKLNSDRVSNNFLFQLMLSKWFQNILAENATGSTAKGIQRKKFEKLKVPIPPLPEQRAIATALSDVDALITSQDKLTAKKRDIKQAAMQELLSGKRRLPGFSGEWVDKKLGDIGECLIGLTYEPSNVKAHGLLVLRSSNVADGELKFEDNVFVDIDVPEKIIVRKDDILICVRNGSRDLIGKCALIDGKAEGMTFGAFMSIFRTPYGRFVFHQFQSDLIKKQIREHLGATINQITNKSLKSFKIPFPNDENERNAIATVLSDMDADLAALEQKRDKTKAIKQGMMQELLTGRIRLV